jgi:hypothetical protein
VIGYDVLAVISRGSRLVKNATKVVALATAEKRFLAR